jgi:hypothetical protein
VIFSAFAPLQSCALLIIAAAVRNRVGRSHGSDKFNRVFASATPGYVNWSRLAIRKTVISFALLAARGRGGFSGSDYRAAFAGRDQGYFVALQLPD